MTRTLYLHQDAHDQSRWVFAGFDQYDRTHTGTRLVLDNPRQFQISEGQVKKIESCFADGVPFDFQVTRNGNVRILTF
jgi:hypothetical protein